MSKKKKLIFIVAVALLFTFSLSSMALGQNVQKVVKIFINGKEVDTQDKKPLIISGTTYVPLRLLGEMFNKTVVWDGANYAVRITDKPDSNVQELQNTIAQLKGELATKEAEIIVLKAQLEALQQEKNKTTSLSDLQKQLQKYYEVYKDIEFDITLKGNTDDIQVIVEVDLDDYKSKWQKLSTKNIETYLQYIVDDILAEFEDADVEGYIKDTAANKKLVTFTVNSKGKVVIDKGIDLSDLEKEIDDEYYDWFYKDYGFYFDKIELEGDEDEIEFYVYLDYDYYEDEWDDFKADKYFEDEIEDFMERIAKEIASEFKDADIYGYILDSSNNNKKLYSYSY